MAKTSSRSNGTHKAIHLMGRLFSVLLLVQQGGAYEFKVGGSSGWTVPTDSNAVYNQWAEKNRFQIGDTLLFVYPSNKDAVLQVTKDDYTNCNTATPIANFSDGRTVFHFNHSGPFYFISTLKDNCLKNEKLAVVVLADRSKRSSTASPPPSPTPAAEKPSSPPAGGPVEIIPSPAPSAEQTPKHNSASALVVSSIGSFATFLGSSLLLGF